MVKSATDVLTDKLQAAAELVASAQADYAQTWDKWASVLQDLNLAGQTIASATDDAVRAARASGMSWAEIGRWLGRTKQSVQQRYGGPE
jgi:hypothetical protein